MKIGKLMFQGLMSILVFLILFLFVEIWLHLVHTNHLQYKLDDQLVWELAPSQFGHPRFGLPNARINSDGFRGEEILVEDSKILMIGDSFTFGWGVNDNETYSYFFNELLDGEYSVINTGVPGWGLFQEYQQFYRVYKKFEPEYVIWYIGSHNFYRVPFENKKEQLFRTKVRIAFSNSILLSYFESRLYELVYGFFDKINRENPAVDVEKMISSQLSYIYEIENKLEFDNKKLILLLDPLGNRDKDNQSFSDIFIQLYDGNSVLVDIKENHYFLNTTTDDLFLSADGHFSRLGHYSVALTLKDEFDKSLN